MNTDKYISKYETFVTEQENRELFDNPVRYTTLETYPDKLSYEEFLEEIKSWGVQENLQSGEHYIEWWIELFLAYHEIENHHKSEDSLRNITIDRLYQRLKDYENLQKEILK